MLPFTRAQFLALFAEYNLAVWPAQVLAYGLGLVMVIALMRPSPKASRAIAAGLALMWAWTGLAYHAAYFARINPAAPIFAGLFVIQSLLLAHAALRGTLRFGSPGRPTAAAGWAMLLYAIVFYPLAGMAAGHRYPELPMFGVTPCPVTLFTFGLLLLTTGPVPLRLLLIPLAWSLVGGSAAFLLGMPQDWPLLVSGLAVLPLLRRRNGVVTHASATSCPDSSAPSGRVRA